MSAWRLKNGRRRRANVARWDTKMPAKGMKIYLYERLREREREKEGEEKEREGKRNGEKIDLEEKWKITRQIIRKQG